jgi:hypothetical protein
MSQIEWIEGFGYVEDVTIDGSLLYVALGSDPYVSGLQIVDISDPTYPKTLSYFSTLDAREVAIGNSIAYIADGFSMELPIIDVSNPSAPVILSAPSVFIEKFGVAVKGNILYVVNADLRTFDVSDPTNPFELDVLNTPGVAVSVAVSNNIAYVADNLEGLRIVDTSDPTNLTEIGFYALTDIRDVKYKAQLVYAAANTQGLQIIDVSDPINPNIVGSLPISPARDLSIDEDHAYVALDNSIRIINVATPSSPTEVGSFFDPSYVTGVAAAGNIAYISGSSAGVYIAQFGQGTSANHAPTITTTPSNTQIHVGELYEYPVEASDLDGDIVNFSLHTTAPFLSITGNLISGIPNSNQVDTFIVEVKADDGNGGVYIQSHLLKVQPSTGIEGQNQLLNTHILKQNYPNPFNLSTTIEYSLPYSNMVEIKIYNAAGQLMGTILNQKKDAGVHSIPWNAYNLSSGIYFYRIQAGEFSTVKKALLIK